MLDSVDLKNKTNEIYEHPIQYFYQNKKLNK